MIHDCTHQFCPICQTAETERRAGADMVPAVEMPFREADPFKADREATRQIVIAAVDTFLNPLLFGPPDSELNLARLWEEAGTMVIPIVKEYRGRRRRAAYGETASQFAQREDERRKASRDTCGNG